MDSIPQDVLQAVTECNNKVAEVQKETESSCNKVRIDYRTRIETLLEQRQEVLDKVEGFWSSVLSSAETPLRQFFNGTIDPKLLRAVRGFNVKSSVKNDSLCRCVSIDLRSNMFAEQGTIHREIDADLNTISLEPIKWKSGTERASQDSLFRFFTPECDDKELVADVLAAFDNLFQDPFLALESSQD
ncbi:template-activating factor I [Trypanosoma theileri]|uniref:Template-activating factor I n=1 Tax=Trypanosoma theileri TaxID=67003 RepID=A0A1X0P944_9TRYP|nr:template-activating factor I [Trypanosoma theileri]ORC93454.1 template-activating factor I [Trypanosoma theileri]